MVELTHFKYISRFLYYNFGVPLVFMTKPIMAKFVKRSSQNGQKYYLMNIAASCLPQNTVIDEEKNSVTQNGCV